MRGSLSTLPTRNRVPNRLHASKSGLGYFGAGRPIPRRVT